MLQSLPQTYFTTVDQELGSGSVYRDFVAVAELHPTRTAIEWQGQSINFATLLTMADDLAAQIVGHDDAATPIGVLASNSPQQVAAYLAASRCGRPYAPLSSEYPQHMLQDLIDRFEIAILAHDDASARRAVELRVACLIDIERLPQQPRSIGPAREARHSGRSNCTCLMFTSGSTGRPKGVGIPYRAIRNLVHYPNYVELGLSDRIAYVANPAFDASLFEIWGALLNGATLVHLPRRLLPDPEALANMLKAERISIIFLTTALFNLVAKVKPAAFQSVRYVLFGGERVTIEPVREVYRRGKPAHLVHVYGPTECTTFSTSYEIEALPEADADLPIGRAIRGAGTAILSMDGAVLQGAGTGELYIFGEGVADGYNGDPQLTQQRFVRLHLAGCGQICAYRTGDLVSRDASGDLVFIERLDDQVKRRGFRFSLREIDEDLLAIPEVQTAKSVRVDTSGLTCRICSFVQLDDPSDAARQRLGSSLLRVAPSFRIPNQIIALKALPLNANGKVDVAQLQRMAIEHTDPHGMFDDAATGHVAVVCDDRLAQIRRVFAAHCLEAQAPPDRDFFEAGGDSLGAVECLLELEGLLGVPLSYSDFMAEPTISGILRMVESARQQEDYDMRRSGSADASRCVVFFGEHGNLLQAALGPDIFVLWRNPTDIGHPDVLDFTSVGELAQVYANRLLPVVSRASIAVVGFSYGAVLGLEMASLLEKAGHCVDELILIDPDVDACCGTFCRGRSQALGAEDFVHLITTHKLRSVVTDVRSGRWRTLRSKMATLARQTMSKAADRVRRDGNVKARRQALVYKCFSHYESYASPIVTGRISLLLTARALEDETMSRADLARMQQAFGRKIGRWTVPGCSSHADFATPAGVRACAGTIRQILAATSCEAA